MRINSARSVCFFDMHNQKNIVHVWCSYLRNDVIRSTSFIKTREDKILPIDEYWGNDGVAPQWRLEKQIGTPICSQNISIAM